MIIREPGKLNARPVQQPATPAFMTGKKKRTVLNRTGQCILSNIS